MSTINTPKQTFHIRLSPNQPKTFAWWTLTLSSLGAPPTPVLDSTFIWDDTETAMAPRLYRLPLICRIPEEARNMTCEIEEDCKCTPAEVKMRCSCKESSLTAHMRHHDYLPQLRPNVELMTNQSQLFARIPQLPTAKFVLHVQGTFQTTSLVSDAVCTIENTHCQGCYKRPKGASATVTCKSSTAKENAEIRCGDNSFTVPCTKNGTPSKSRFYADTARFLAICTVHCGKVRHRFEITGILHYTGSISMAITRLINGESVVFSEINLPDISHIVDVFLNWSGTLLLTVGLVAAAFSLTYLCIANSFVLVFLRMTFRFLTFIAIASFYLLCIPLRLSTQRFTTKSPEKLL
ncbi:unnamed protein product [Haemonchus placei]|uniref:Phlebovirus_G2 domain-containing protein n=1 Tax=Haemonchus placei TaxID=6290 RepID=A0A0N4WY25_HAEPC|nr:unnamed protein product [Haemonchus placei]